VEEQILESIKNGQFKQAWGQIEVADLSPYFDTLDFFEEHLSKEEILRMLRVGLLYGFTLS